MRRVTALLSAAVLAACTPSPSSPAPSSQPGGARPPLNVGVVTDAPGLGTLDPTSHVRAGFDTDLYRWLANADPKFNPVPVDMPTKDRVPALVEGRAGMVVASFSITDERRKSISFAGPYLETQQGVLVRAGDRRITGVDHLAGMAVCAQTGSTSKAQLERQQGVTITEATGPRACVDMLLAHHVDAVSTDQLLLYGFAKADSRLELVPGLVFGAKERYGVGLPKGDGTLCRQVSEKLRTFMTSGAWEEFFRANFGELSPAGHKPDPYRLDPC